MFFNSIHNCFGWGQNEMPGLGLSCSFDYAASDDFISDLCLINDHIISSRWRFYSAVLDRINAYFESQGMHLFS